MRGLLLTIGPLLLLCSGISCQLPTLYQYFTDGGINSGLVANHRDYFTLNGKQLKIMSGSLHYFRVHPDYWRDRLRKFRAAGLNTIDVYVPWNLHEPERGVFDFGNGGRDFSQFLDLPTFIQMAKEEDLFVIFRPGPYICGEWEFGGLPSWLLSENPMFLRTTHQAYQTRADIFINEVVSRVKDLQFYTASGMRGGPIIMAQVENEYGNFGYTDFPRDIEHLRQLRQTMESAGIESLLFTSDSPALTDDWGNVDGLLMTANFKFQSQENLDRLVQLQPNRPILVSEYWPGWFDHWFEPYHNTLSLEDFTEILSRIFAYQGSVNFFMFHGGTNFGFMNGANVLETDGIDVFPHYAPDVTSYDYDAPLTESGEYTPKYDRAAELIAAYDPLANTILKPDRPVVTPPTAYATVQMTEYLSYDDIIERVPSTSRVFSPTLLSMEELSINNGNGQSYGYIVYRKTMFGLQSGSKIQIRGHVRDCLQLMINGKMVNQPLLKLTDLTLFGSWGPRDSEFTVDLSSVPTPPGQSGPCTPSCTLDFFVENLGRVNFGRPHVFQQKKGLWEGVVNINGEEVRDWEIMALEFKNSWVQSLSGWQPYNLASNSAVGPRIVKGTFSVAEAVPRDTYFDYNCAESQCSDWKHGAVFVNGFNVGRYHQVGPQKTLYIPGPLLKQGINEIIVMENYLGSDELRFTSQSYYGPVLG